MRTPTPTPSSDPCPGTVRALQFKEGDTANFKPGGPIRTFFVSLLGAATLTAGLLLVRQQQKEAETEARQLVPAGEKMARTVSLERLRELGL